MTLDPWSNIDNLYDVSKTNALVGSINSVFITMAWSGAVISLLTAFIMIMLKGAKNRDNGKKRLYNVAIIIICISGLTSIVGIIMSIVQSI